MTQLREVMPEELQRLNFSSTTIRVTPAPSSRSPDTSVSRPISLAQNISASGRPIFCTNEN